MFLPVHPLSIAFLSLLTVMVKDYEVATLGNDIIILTYHFLLLLCGPCSVQFALVSWFYQ